MPASSPFENAHRAAGAELRPVEGAVYPIRFGHPFEEHAALRAAAGLVDLSFLGKLEVAGADAREFLQRLFSAELADLAPGSGRATYLLNGQGKILHAVSALATPDGFLLLTETGGAPALAQELERALFQEKVGFRDFSDDLGTLLLAGPRAAEILEATAEGALPQDAPLSHAFVRIEGSSVLAVRDRSTGFDGFLLHVLHPAAEAVLAALVAVGSPKGLQRVGLAAYDALRLEAGRPRFGLDYTNDLFPQEVALDDAFSLTKGCYPGQETVARIDTYGKVHRRLVGVVMDSPKEDLPERGDKLLREGEEVGDLRSWAISPVLERPIGLAVVRNAKAPAGSVLEIRAGERSLSAKVVDLPIVAPQAPARE